MRLNFLILGFVFGVSAVWRVEFDAIVRATRRVIRCALGACDISDKEAAGIVGMDKGQFSRMVENGGNLAALVVIAVARLDFAYQLLKGLAALFVVGDRRKERLDQIPTPGPTKCLEVFDGSSLGSSSRSRSAVA